VNDFRKGDPISSGAFSLSLSRAGREIIYEKYIVLHYQLGLISPLAANTIIIIKYIYNTTRRGIPHPKKERRRRRRRKELLISFALLEIK
jgi:hypothetical protein